MPINSYIENIARDYARGIATEHTFRPALKALIEELVPEVAATNEPKRIECGAPDYVITRKDIPVGYIEAKDVGVDLDGKNLKEQFDRYRDALDNLVFTDYLDFRFYINGDATASIRIGEVRNGKIVALPERFNEFTSLIKEFCSRTPQTIKSSKRLAEMMAEKAKILAFIIKNALEEDIAAGAQSDLTNQMKAFKDILIHDIDAKAFADIYAQTIAYGMFAARLHDDTLDTFSRQEAANKIPKTNPFLRKLFQFIAAFDLDTRIDWIVDALADLFRATDIAAILKNFGKSTQTHDPIMHFYETFLAEYDPKLRKSRGVFYTPEPVVDFIVRAVDDILKTEFNLPNGIADTSKVKVKEKTPVVKKGKGTVYEDVEKEYHKVQILDPATGTGTFLATVIKHIYEGFENQQGVWSQYVDEHLIPRLNGFELLMASYAMAHLKLDLLLSETGYKPAISNANDQRRFQVYLTNALEEYHPDTGTLFASWLSTEANEANHIKRDTPVMVVIGNPPYSVSSSNRSVDEDGKKTWIGGLIDDYKKDLNERKINLDDDYIKFIRFGQHFVEKNGDGILAFITNNSFLDGVTHRQMRKSLMEAFDAIYVLNLHGSSTLVETAPGGGKDVNVFDIKQGVTISLCFRNRKTGKHPLAKVWHGDIFGTREFKYDFLSGHSISTTAWTQIDNKEPYWFFVPKDFAHSLAYNLGFGVSELFNEFNTGIQTKRDKVTISFTLDEAAAKVNYFRENDSVAIRGYFDLPADGRDWTIADAKKDLMTSRVSIEDVFYRPFDIRKIIYTGKTKGIVAYPRNATSKHLLRGNNCSLITLRINGSNNEFVSVVTDKLIEKGSLPRGNYSFFPLYLYADEIQPSLDERTDRVPNLNSEIVDKIAAAIGLNFTNEKEETDGTFAPIDILDYIYAVLHSPSYREKYKEFLKIDFPRVPYPKDAATFRQLVALGGELRQIHLLESPVVSRFITSFNVDGDGIVEKPEYKNGNVYFNPTQCFENVPEIAWNFYIGGYRPAYKWLNDRKGRKLAYDDIQHYQKIIVALTETDRIMKEIDKIGFVE